MPEAHSVSTGIWVGVGSRDETAQDAGVSHFLEHLLFKGTERRTARSIAIEIDAVGGEMNAFTTREHTAFYTRLPVEHVSLGLDLLTDVVGSPAFRPLEIEAEREVILEEILMSEDAPDDVVMKRLYEGLFSGHPLGRETLGCGDTVESIDRNAIAAFHEANYRPVNLVVAAAGDLHHEQIVEAVSSFLADGEPGRRLERAAPGERLESLTVEHRPTEQAHLAIGWRAVDVDDPDRYALWVGNQVLGGSTSSRLFQEVREERGLAYTVFSSPSSFADSGALSFYAATGPGRLGELIDVVNGVLADVIERGITAEEREVAVGCLTGSMALGLEDSASRMARLGGGEITRGEVIPIEEQMDAIRAVTLEDVHRVCSRILGGPRAVSVVGPFEADDSVLARALG